jgi:predicted aldo/keto reductase-like oxidoreductase
MMDQSAHRRHFLQAGAAGLAALGMTSGGSADGTAHTNSGGIPLRSFGRIAEKVSVLALGGHHSTDPGKLDESSSLRLIQRAVDEGITFLDNCWDYHDGLAEERMGKALAQGKLRDKVFLMTKVCGRTAKEARSNLEDSLRRLQTDRLDLWQFHEIVYDNDPDWIFAADGAIEVALKAVEEGKVRYIGFTGHKHPAIHLRMLEKPYPWASVQMPINVMDAHYRSFQKKVLPLLLERGVATIGMKSLGGDGSIVARGGVRIEDALGYALSQPIATLVSGIDSEKVLDQNLKIAREFQPFSPSRMAEIEKSVVGLAGDGRFELFKSSQAYDGKVHRKQHGFSTS